MSAKDVLVPVVAAVAILALWVIARGMRTIRRLPRTADTTPPAWVPKGPADYEALLRAVRGELARNCAGKIDWTQPIEQLRMNMRRAVEQLVDVANPRLNRIEREKLIDEVVDGIRPPGATPS